MVQGLPAVKWTPENNAKLLAAIVTLHSGAIDLKKLAAIFGPNVPVAAISYRMSTLRKEGAGFGIKANGSAGRSTTARRAAAVRNNKSKGRKRAGGLLSDEQSDDEESVDIKDEADGEQELTPPETDSANNGAVTPKASNVRQKTISGRVTKARVSPRKTEKKDYKALEDPFMAMNETTDADGEKVFDTEKSDGEESVANDEDYMKHAKAATVKMEEAI